MVTDAQSLAIIYRDDDIVAINKPAGLLVTDVPKITGTHLIHRLDRDTSGVLLTACNQHNKELLQEQFKQRKVHKEYLALLDGVLDQSYLSISSYLARNPHDRRQMASYRQRPDDQRTYRDAHSKFFVEQCFGNRLSLVRVVISSGRTHQIRVHAKTLGAPVLGDRLYHRQTTLPQSFPLAVRKYIAHNVQRQMLHASILICYHPRQDQQLTIIAPLAQDLLATLEILRTNNLANGEKFRCSSHP